MAKNDIIHGHYHKALAKEISRVLSECERLGIFVNKSEASAIVAMKSKKGPADEKEIIAYIKRLKGAVV